MIKWDTNPSNQSEDRYSAEVNY